MSRWLNAMRCLALGHHLNSCNCQFSWCEELLWLCVWNQSRVEIKLYTRFSRSLLLSRKVHANFFEFGPFFGENCKRVYSLISILDCHICFPSDNWGTPPVDWVFRWICMNSNAIVGIWHHDCSLVLLDPDIQRSTCSTNVSDSQATLYTTPLIFSGAVLHSSL